MKTSARATIDDLVRLQFEARGFSWLPRQPVHSLLSGRHTSRLRGRGLTFEELRDYRPGDDIRTMDWKATARLRKPHVRVYTEERERPVLLVVDQRTSMFFGSARTTKATAAAEFAALGAWRSLDVGDRVGAIIFGEDEICQIRPHRSRENVLRICHELVRFGKGLRSGGGPANGEMLNEALKRTAATAKHDFLVVLVTDYHGDDQRTQKLATQIASHNDVLAALVYDPLGIAFPVESELAAFDGEYNRSFRTGGRFDADYRAQFENRARLVRERLKAIRIPVLPICTHEPVIEQLRSAIGGLR